MHVAVVGAGPAGLIAAESLAKDGIQVALYDARRSFGRKFLLAGRSGLNLTHDEPLEQMTARYGEAADFLAPALRSYPPAQLRSWCEGLGHPTFVGTSGRVFPESLRATPLLRAWLGRLADLGVQFHPGHRWSGWGSDGELLFATSDGTVQAAPDATIFALGGASWPGVSSDGSWAAAFIDAGIAVTPFLAANCGVHVDWSAPMRTKFAGVPVKNVVVSVNDAEQRGDIVVTDTGFEGGPIYALGPAIRADSVLGATTLVLDLHPDLTVEQLELRLAKRRPKSSTASWLRSNKIAEVSVGLVREATGNQVPTEPRDLARLLKQLPMQLTGLAPLDRAISTAGGIALNEVDENSMLTKLPATYVAGEMMDWEAPTGGYLLQACFSTGQAAADGVRLLSNS